MAGLLPPAERGSGLLLALYAAVSLLLLVGGSRIPTASLRGVGAFLFAPLDRVVLVADRMAAGWRENQRLQQRTAELELEVERLRADGIENRRLRDLMELPTRRLGPLRPVEFLSLSGEPIASAATVSAGTRHGVEVGDVVITAEGLVGRIGEAYPFQSRVVLLTDPGSAVACEVESTAVLGVLRFVMAPRPRLMLTGIPLSDTVRVGQRVMTSALSSRFPRGLFVGTVERVTQDTNGLMQYLELKPAARMSRLRYGYVMDVTKERP